MREKRYEHAAELIKEQRVKRILEIGVCHCVNAKTMIEAAVSALHSPDHIVQYYGFDLFRNESTPAPEAVKDEHTHPLSISEAKCKLRDTGAEVNLIQGSSLVTLPAFTAGKPDVFDLIFIDGGHDFETVLSDWLNVQPLIGPNTIILFDDYFTNGYKVDGGNWGINGVVHSINRNIYHTEVLPNSDQYDDPWDDLCLVKVTRI